MILSRPDSETTVNLLSDPKITNNTIRAKSKYTVLIILNFLVSTITALSQNPAPTPFQFPPSSIGTIDPLMVARDDRGINHGGEILYLVKLNDVNNQGSASAGEIYLDDSQTGTYGIMSASSVFYGGSTSERAAIKYGAVNPLLYGVDTGYYYLKRRNLNTGEYFVSNLALLTILITPNDDAKMPEIFARQSAHP